MDASIWASPNVHADLRSMRDWLIANADTVGNTVLMPLVGKGKTKKNPLHKHATQPWTWKECDQALANAPAHKEWSILLDKMCVVDADTLDAIKTIERHCDSDPVARLALSTCPIQQTKQGRHYFFARPSWADEEGYWDGARQHRDKKSIDADFKSRCSTGTRGVLVVSPSENKTWLAGRAPWSPGVSLPQLPRALADLVAKPRSNAKSRSSTKKMVPPAVDAAESSAERVVDAALRQPQSAQAASSVERLLLLLTKTRWDDRSSWRDIATALKNEYGDAYKDLWKRLSQISAKYDEAAADVLWESVSRSDYSGPALTMRTIHAWALADNPIGYHVYKMSTIPTSVKDKYDQDDRGLGEIAGDLLKHAVKRVDKSSYYYFDPSVTAWVPCDDSRLRLIVSHALEEALTDLSACFSLQLSGARRATTLDDPDREIAALEAKRDKVLSTIKYVRTYNGMSRVMHVASPLFADPDFKQKLDSVRHLLGVKNGVVDLRDGKLRARVPEDMICNILDVEYDPCADTSVMDSLVLSAMADDAEMARFLQKMLGYGITGEVSEEVFPVWTGSGRNAKGTLSQLLQRLLGNFYKEMNCAVIVDRNVCNIDAERAKLLGGRVAVFNELRPGDKLKTNEVQLLSGGDGIPAKPMYKDPLTIEPRHLCILTTNHMPELSEVIPAIVERLLCVHFPVTFVDLLPGEEPTPFRRQRDNSLKERLYGDLPAALKWLVDGSVAWYTSRDLKRNAPEKVKAFSRRYFDEQDKIGQFLRERCKVAPGLRQPSAALLSAFNEWAGRDGQVSEKMLPAMLRAKGFDKKRMRVGDAILTCFEGLELVNDCVDCVGSE